MRLDKFLSQSTDLSRKDIKQLIKKKLVTVGDETVLKPDIHVNEGDTVTVDGVRVEYKPFVYLVLNKPSGYVSATKDRDYPVVTELVPTEFAHFDVFPVGRLDIDTEGLLILTNDGDFAHSIASPKKNVYKRYFARLDKAVEPSDTEAFASGMQFKDFTAKPAKLEACSEPTEAYVEIAEGKYHQVKRMFERVGKNVVYLKRVAVGGLELPENLASGKVWEISLEELMGKIYGE